MWERDMFHWKPWLLNLEAVTAISNGGLQYCGFLRIISVCLVWAYHKDNFLSTFLRPGFNIRPELLKGNFRILLRQPPGNVLTLFYPGSFSTLFYTSEGAYLSLYLSQKPNTLEKWFFFLMSGYHQNFSKIWFQKWWRHYLTLRHHIQFFCHFLNFLQIFQHIFC